MTSWKFIGINLFIYIFLFSPLELWGLKSYSILKEDTLKIGNDLIERTFLWNQGNLHTLQLEDKQSGHIWYNKSNRPDLYITELPLVGDGNYQDMIIEESYGRTGHLEIIIDCDFGEFQVKKIYTLFDEAPAIACDFFFKGEGSSIFRGGLSTNPADLKNIESIDDALLEMEHPVMDHIKPGGKHWDLKAVEFLDVTDMCNNLVVERNFLPFRKAFYRGNLLIAKNKEEKGGFFYLKEAPCSNTQLGYHDADFCIEFDEFNVLGCGFDGSDLSQDDWIKGYGVVMGLYSGDEHEALKSLRTYQKQIRKNLCLRDEMVMMNTWGDRGQDKKVNEKFCLDELEKASKLGITHFQIDDGWQTGRSPNSAFKGGSFKDIWHNSDYWKPNPEKYPNGLKPVVDKSKELGITLGLWFNPSIQNAYEDWEKDASAIIDLYKEYGITVFKIDGIQIPDKKSETNLRKFFDYVTKHSNDSITFNMDVTAGRRGGYHSFNEYGNFFIENRYTDWGIYYPYWTLRNLWQLSKYVPAERLQTVFLNKWRNKEQYENDKFAPSNYSFDYIFAVAIAGQPLAWFEATGLPEEAFELRCTIDKYKKIQHEFHSGIILPIGEEPSGESWTGFQSEKENSGFFLIFRENNSESTILLPTYLKEGTKINTYPILGFGEILSHWVGKNGNIEVKIPEINQFMLCRYDIVE